MSLSRPRSATEYTYDASHRMPTLKDPRGITYLTNAYDSNGRVITQTQADGTAYQSAYTVNVNNTVALPHGEEAHEDKDREERDFLLGREFDV